MSPAASVLFIDGNESERQYYTERLKPHYLIFESPSAKTGLDFYGSKSVDCVVLDLELPDTSGFEVLGRLIPVASRPGIAVVVLTRLTSPSLLDLAVKKGAKYALHKPSTSGDILDKAALNAISIVRSEKKGQARIAEGFPPLD
jgi:PleD family two-component response regulator